jgi:hypothetical protein
MNKIISMQEAVEWVNSDCLLGLGGMTLYRRPLAFSRALLQPKVRRATQSYITHVHGWIGK